MALHPKAEMTRTAQPLSGKNYREKGSCFRQITRIILSARKTKTHQPARGCLLLIVNNFSHDVNLLPQTTTSSTMSFQATSTRSTKDIQSAIFRVDNPKKIKIKRTILLPSSCFGPTTQGRPFVACFCRLYTSWRMALLACGRRRRHNIRRRRRLQKTMND